MFTPSHVIKTFIRPRRAYFTRYGCAASVELPGEVLDVLHFYGNDGRVTRREAEAWAHARAEQFAKARATAWRDVRDSSRTRWG